MRKLRHASSLTRWAIPAVLIGLAIMAIPRVIGPSALEPALQAFGGITDEAVNVWQHRDLDVTGAPGPTGWDPWYSVLGKDSTSTFAWHATGGPVPQAAPIAKLTGDDKNPHVSTLGGPTPGTLSTFTTAVWQHAAGTGSLPGDWDIHYSTLNADGTWTTPAPVSVLVDDDYDPNVAVAANGNALAVWVHRSGINDTSARTMFYSVRTGSGWSAPAAIGPSNGQVSLPEVTLTSVTATGSPLLNKAVAVWADVTAPGGLTHQMFYSTFDGTSWTPPATIPTESGDVGDPAIADVGFANYVGTDPDPYGAFGRNGVTADGLGFAYVVWSGGPQTLGVGSAGVVGAILDVAPNTWADMCTSGTSPCPFARFIGIGGCENPDDAMTTPNGDFSGVFDFAGIIEDTFRTGGNFTGEQFAWDDPGFNDFRPSNAGLSATEIVGVDYVSSTFAAIPIDPFRDIVFSIGAVTPGIDIMWGPASDLVPGGLPGEDLFPELSSAFGAEIVKPKANLTLEPAFAENPVGTPHILTATVTIDGVPQNGVTVTFTVTPDSGSTSTPTPPGGSCVTGATGQCQFTYTSPTPGSDTITATATVIIDGEIVTLTATAKKVWVAPAAGQEGRITGGALFDDGTVRVTYGFQLHCDATVVPNSLQVNWKDPVSGAARRFHMTLMQTANCSNDPLITPDPPPDGLTANDTHDGTGTGRLNGQSGAFASWTLKDAGEPGGGVDFVHFHINDPNNVTVLSITGFIQRGDHQFHNK